MLIDNCHHVGKLRLKKCKPHTFTSNVIPHPPIAIWRLIKCYCVIYKRNKLFKEQDHLKLT